MADDTREAAGGAGWLPEPTARLFDNGRGKPDAGYVQFREGKALRVDQFDPARMVYLYVGRDGFPVGVKALEPMEDTTFVLYRVIGSWANGHQPACPPPSDPSGFVTTALGHLNRVNEWLREAQASP
jgi:hypothetical protein